MNYKETLDFLFSQLPVFQRIGAAAYKANLDNTYALMSLLGDPHKKFKSVHIAGTNGKGSTAHMLASIYQESGYKTGLYTSPHLKDFRERIRINGKMISEKYVIDFVDKYREDFIPISPSFFELTMAMAFQYFADEKVDLVILETGMGGRLDSTNIVTPQLSVITNIGFDHMQFLGDNLPQIAAEKAGIIKEKIPVLIGEKQLDTTAVFKAAAAYRKADLFFAEDLIELKEKDDAIYSVAKQGEIVLANLQVPLKGNYQTKNVRTVLAAAEILNLPLDAVKRGIEKVQENVTLLGRWQTLQVEPLAICDTAHNQAGLTYVMNQLNQMTYQKLHFVLGVVNDKEIDKMLDLLPKSAVYYFCKAAIPRGLDAEMLRVKAKEIGLEGEVYSSVLEAFRTAKKHAGKSDLIFVGGSTFTVAEVV
ncbi:MAG: bifunctional folylpolyglutamate synthase/dihydrofolate synthase [Bacteroidales bacterium]|nr:bifunctional folylpolyglutamate synthase/dihydrofolate synthase [Bacteroidales bacterium]